ncbi:hypothetical protein [Thioclava sp. F36-6]|uniref:hypothetical protein n=1 Tax=Thioclava sp. F36-6 TaxID=1915316 RepID=UPI000997950A|nr:hypothetical protein [Thioclava sp. F36-6]OOY31616.1 hypothetical protein BMI88_11100 [Thioclava sp. F36-6]
MAKSKTQSAGKMIAAAFVMDAVSGITRIKPAGRRKSTLNVSGVKVETYEFGSDVSGVTFNKRTETAIETVQEAFAEVESAASPVAHGVDERSSLAVLESDDMWWGNPKDMPDEDLAFFGLEK